MLRAVSVVDQWDAGPWAFFHQMFFSQAQARSSVISPALEHLTNDWVIN